MTITRHNYEEFFLLYLDNELSVAQRQMVEEFVQQNPDFEKEWQELQQSKLRPDKALSFPNKESLLQIAAAGQFIHFTNYLECFLLYADDELSPDQKHAVEQFVYNHPQLQQEFELIHEARMIPDNSTVFPGKENLYRHEKATRPLLFAWWKPAAAAAVLILAGLLWLYQSPAIKPEATVAKVPPVILHPKDVQTEKALDHIKDALANTDPLKLKQAHADKTVEGPVKEKMAPLTAHKKALAEDTGKDLPASINGTETVSIDKNPLSRQIGNAKKDDTETAVVDPSALQTSQLALRNREVVVDEVSDLENSQPDARNALLTSSDEKSDNVVFTNIPVNKKPGLRRFFRKASRYIDKNTAFRSGDKSGILIGNIKIAFQ